MESRDAIRQRARAARQSLTQSQQTHAARQLLAHALAAGLLNDCDSLALYYPQDGEIDPQCIAQAAWLKQIPLYLPVIDPDIPRRMVFHQWLPTTQLRPNRFGIPEPRDTPDINTQQLHTVLLPLVAFDKTGNRLGMGGGFYDQTFEYTRFLNKTRLIGLAHACQEQAQLASASWDIPLSGILTDEGYQPCMP